MKRLVAALLLALGAVYAFPAQSVNALSLKVAPLEYRIALKPGERQKGVIDVSNPTGEKLKVTTSVQAFRQVSDDGTIEFYDDERLNVGIKTDFETFSLAPKETLRMYFLVDGTKLPSGDVYGAIFFATAPASKEKGVSESVKLGTLLSIVNGTPSSRSADITGLRTSFFHFGNSVSGSYKIRNTANPKTSTGFYPEVNIELKPFYYAVKHKSSLVFAGRERANDFKIKASRLGFYKLRVSYKDSYKEKWIFLIGSSYIWLVVILAPMVIVSTIILLNRVRTAKKRANRPE